VGAMTAAMDGVTKDVIAIIAKKLRDHQRELKLDDRLDELGLDSFAAVEMIFDLEEKFDIQIPYNSNDARMEFETVGDVVEAIKKRIGQA
jgi:acyl carrier protein